jgi:hypothetical protein
MHVFVDDLKAHAGDAPTPSQAGSTPRCTEGAHGP